MGEEKTTPETEKKPDRPDRSQRIRPQRPSDNHTVCQCIEQLEQISADYRQ